MSITTVAFLSAFVALSVVAFRRPIWGIGLYILVYFAFPPVWWWGRSLPFFRWSLYSGLITLASVIASGTSNIVEDARVRATRTLLALMLLNATAVHFLLAPNMAISADTYILLIKFGVLYLLIVSAIRTPVDFHIGVLIFVVAAGYWGHEVTINGRGNMEQGRLEGLGGPDTRTANLLASCVATLIPLIGAVALAGTKRTKILAIVIAPLVVNVLLLANSRGAFLSIIVAAIAFLYLARGKLRKKAAVALALGGLGTFMLMGDVRIFERFLTTFASKEQRDGSAATRLQLWKAGLNMVRDFPLGSGGEGFKKVRGKAYRSEFSEKESRSVHNGYINEACEWGVQGLLLRLMFLGVVMRCVQTTMNYRRLSGDLTTAFFGACILASMLTFLGTCMFTSVLDGEWGFWMAGLGVGYARVYGEANAKEIQRVAARRARKKMQAQKIEMGLSAYSANRS